MTNKEFNSIIKEMVEYGYIYDKLELLKQDNTFDIYKGIKDMMKKCWSNINLLYTSFLLGLLTTNINKENIFFISNLIEELFTNLYNLYYIQSNKQEGINIPSEKFNEYIKNKIKSVLSSKAIEYATKDRLHNFNKLEKKLAPLIDLHKSPYIKCLDFMCKHLVSIDDIINNENPVPLSKEIVEEKFIDALNYCILLKACTIEVSKRRC